MAIGVINVPMCQSFSDTPGSLRVGVLGGGGRGEEMGRV